EADGFCILSKFLSGKQLSLVDREFDKMLGLRSYSEGIATDMSDDLFFKNVRLKQKDLSHYKLDEIINIFNCDLFKQVSNHFFDKTEYAFNFDFFLNQTKGKKEWLGYAFDPHFDKRHTLKFFLYLNDVSARNGALAVEPGSHEKNRSIRQKLIKDKIPYPDWPSTFKHSKEIIPIEAEAGSLIIFDTDTTHHAGQIEEGEMRKIIRSHCRGHYIIDLEKDLT
ncbi:MAG: hypothetical protein HOI70_04380, partial [Opitutae bacterium]|nr:hypothetical protein [Opitutae bacterium]